MLEAVHDDHNQEDGRPEVAVEADLAPEVVLPSLLALGGDESTDLGLNDVGSRDGVEERELWARDRSSHQEEGRFMGKGSWAWRRGVRESVEGRVPGYDPR